MGQFQSGGWINFRAALPPELVVLDEAQRITSWSTRTARSVKQIVSPYATVLTGTPLENRLEELISIVQFVDQHRLMIALQNMRMACDSTYLLDGQTDSGGKSEEVMTLLDELFERPESKVVIFSQWLRMHELLVRRLETRRWGHVLFHGGIDAKRRGALVDRFRDDPSCRAFLSTDAGGVGLNLQHASVVVNVDLPWNPAVLEQRIARVHRLGQKRPVQVVNLVAQGTIEEGMLSLLGFKRAVFTGVLDGGDAEVFLGGSRLARFMETVEKATAASGTPPLLAEETAGGDEADVDDATAGEPPAVEPPSADGALARLLEGGLALLGELTRAARTPAADGAGGERAAGPIQLACDQATGESYLRVRVPDSAALARALDAATDLIESLRGRAAIG